MKYKVLILWYKACKGKIDFIFVDNQYHNLNLWDKLMKSAFEWFKENSIVNIHMKVVYDN